MGFFNPALLWFMIGGSIPIIIHLLHRQKYRRVRWAAMEFLLAALKKTQRRLRIENLLLLLIRILIMLILALALARPFFREAPLTLLQDSDTHHVFVIDNSYSMGNKEGSDSRLDRAKKDAQGYVDKLKRLTEQDKLSVLLMSSFPEVFIAESNKLNRVREQMAEIKLSHFGTNAHTTFQKIKEVVDKSRNQQKRVYVFTDFQRNAWESADDAEFKRFAELTKGLTANPNIKVYFFDAVDPEKDKGANVGIVDLRCENPLVTVKSSTRFTVDLHNWSAASFPGIAVNFFVDGALHKTESRPLPANSTINVPFKHDFIEPGAHFVEVSIEPDTLQVDDRRSLSLDVKDGLTGMLIDGEPGNKKWASETDYLRFVLELADLFKLDRQVTPEMFDAEGLEKYDFIAVCNVQSLTQEKVDKLEKFVKGGGGLLLSGGGRVDRGWYNEFLWKEGKGLLPAQLGEVQGAPADQDNRQPFRIQNYQRGHRIFSAFDKGLAKAPRELVFYQYFRLEKHDAAGVVADLDDNFSTPLWLEKAYGEGRVLFFNNTMDEAWNLQVPGRPPYAVMMIRACEILGSRPVGRRNLFVGDFISMQMTADKFQRDFVLDTPAVPGGEGQITISPSAPSAESQTFWIKYPQPPPERREGEPKPTENEGLRWSGRYRLDRSNARLDERPIAYFAVNLPPRVAGPEELHRAEGNLERIGEDELRKRFPDFKFEVIGRADNTGGVDLKAPAAGLWKHLLYALMILLGLETLLAWVFGKAKQ